MRHLVLFFLACLAFTASSVHAQSSTDPGDLFVNAYMAVQQGEKAEQAGDFKTALTKLRFAATILDSIATKFPTWQPPIVAYRKSRTGEAITRVQEKIARFGNGKGTPSEGPPGVDQTLPPTPPPLPQMGDEKPLFFEGSAPPVGGSGRPPANTSSAPSTGSRGSSKTKPPERGTDGDLFEEAAQRMKKLQVELKTARDEAERLQSEKADLARKLEEAAKAREASEQKQQVLQKRADNAEQALLKGSSEGRLDTEKLKALQTEYSEAKRQLRDLKIETEADIEYRKQLDDRFKVALNKIGALTQERDAANKAGAEAPGKIQAIQKQLDLTKKEKDDLATKLQKTEVQLTTVTQQRDDALTQVAKLKDAQKQVDKLVADNASLMAKLSEAEKSVTQFKTEGAQKDKEIAALRNEVGTVKEQLAQAKKESADYQRQMADLQSKLEESGKQLAMAKADNAIGAAERKKIVEENSILRGVVLRQMKEEAIRGKTRKVVLAELANLEINSKTLLKQIEFLSQPVVTLSESERALFKKPELQISDTEISLAMPRAEDVPLPPSTEPAPPVASKSPEPGSTLEAKPVPAATPASATQAKASPSGKRTAEAKATPPKSTPPKTEIAKTTASRTPEPSKPVEQPALPLPEPKPALSLDQPLKPASSMDLALAKPPVPALPNTPSPQILTTPTTPAPSKSASDSPARPTDEKPVDTTSAGMGAGEMIAPSGPGAPNVPPDMMPLAREGKEQFERGNNLEAEKTYRKILAKAPNNLYTLSNLGVVLFRSGKYKPAEEIFKKAIAVAPEDGFSHCTLGIVYYSQNKFDEAVNELTKALALNSKNATAHNYLGITASQKGWQEAAQKELETAISIDPTYADAHFNLAVVFATQTPPNKEEARKHYKKATELGAEPDTALEQLIK